MPHRSDRLPPEDAIFLYLESRRMPLHIGSVSILDGEVPFDTYVDFIESKLPLIRRYRQRLVFPPFNVGHPSWEDDPNFDIRNHIRHVRLKRGTHAELQAFSGQIFSKAMDRNKPLWDLTLVDGLGPGQSAFISRVHHCLVDGISGVGIINVMLSASRDYDPPTHKQAMFHPGALPDRATSLLEAIVNSYTEITGRVLSAEATALDLAQALTNEQTWLGWNRLASLSPEVLTPIDRLPFNKPVRGPRRVVWTEVPISHVSAIRKSCGGTLNDVVLAAVTAAVRTYIENRGYAVKNRLLRFMVPVNKRPSGDENGFGNRVSALPVNVPLDIRDPTKLLNAITERTTALKNAHFADLVQLAALWTGAMPPIWQPLLGPAAALFPDTPFNMVCTNVPGPQSPLYLLGREMLTFYPYVPIGGTMGLGCAVQSYNGKLYFGFTADSAAVPDAGRLGEYVEEAFAGLLRAAGAAPVEREALPPPAEAEIPETAGVR